jgi:hypothetical protein
MRSMMRKVRRNIPLSLPLRGIIPAVLILTAANAFGAARSFSDIFPYLNETKKNQAFSSTGYSEFNLASAGLQLAPHSKSGRAVSDPVLSRRPSFYTENLLVVPYPRQYSGLITMYNALNRVRSLSGRLHRDDAPKDGPVFKEATRIDISRRNNPLPDPSPVSQIPPAETIYMRLKDANFGNSYYKMELSATQEELFYTLSNFRTIYFTIFPAIKEDKFIARLYIEPISEGILIYSVIGAEIPDIMMSKINTISNIINKRMDVIIDWLIDGIK